LFVDLFVDSVVDLFFVDSFVVLFVHSFVDLFFVDSFVVLIVDSFVVLLVDSVSLSPLCLMSDNFSSSVCASLTEN
jgi:hypothetical protein